MSAPPRPGPVPDWKLERFLLGELPAAEAAEVARMAATEPPVGARLEALRAEGSQLLARYPAPWLARQVRQRLAVGTGSEPGGWRRFATWPLAAPAAALAAALALLLSLPVDDGSRPAPTAAPGVRLKGTGPRLVLYRQTATGSEPLAAGARVGAGDRVQVQYLAAGAAYGAILSVDDRGAVTRHLPEAGERAAPLRPDGPVALEFSYQLDATPGRERFYFVTADAPFALEPVLAAARAAAAGPDSRLRLGADQAQCAFVVLKAEAPVAGP
ncbi:MAG: ActD-like protein [Gemmatimonadota bacterium]